MTHSKELRLRFPHGLGDCANWAQALLLWRTRGYNISVEFEDNKAWLWNALEYERCKKSDHPVEVPFYHPECFGNPEHDELRGNKTAWSLCAPPMPEIGTREALWNDLAAIRVDVRAKVGQIAREDASKFLKHLPEPIVLLHTHGSTTPEYKSIPDHLCLPIYNALLDELGGTLVLLDWDSRMPRLAHGRVRHISDDWGHIDLEQLAALMARAQLFIGVDSGPLHFAALVADLPILGLWTHHLPWHLALRPNSSTVHLMPHYAQNREHRWNWHLVEWSDSQRKPEAGPDPSDVAKWARLLLGTPRFFEKSKQGPDLVFQHLINCLRSRTPTNSRADRDLTVSYALERLQDRKHPFIVETGCVRSFDDWGAGYFGYIIASWLWHRGGGQLISVDNDQEKLSIAQQILRPFQQCVELVHSDSVQWLAGNQRPLDLLYLDALDTEHALHAEYCLEEIKAAASGLTKQSLVLIDDTPWDRGGWVGKGRLAVPWLLNRGWRIIQSGYQILLERPS